MEHLKQWVMLLSVVTLTTALPIVGCENGGQYNTTSRKCVCGGGYTGFDCSCPPLACYEAVACKNGGCYNCSANICNCPPGWGGIACDICETNDVCGGTSVCDKSMIVVQQKSAMCTVADKKLNKLLGGTIVVSLTCNFDNVNAINSTDNSCDIQVWSQPSGAPEVFGCTISKCGFTRDDKQIHYLCAEASCQCGPQWSCSPVLSTILKGIKTKSTIDCDLASKTCLFEQTGQPIPIHISCDVGECLAPADIPVVIPPSKQLTTTQWVAIGSSLFMFLLLGCVLRALWSSRNRKAAYRRAEDSFNNSSAMDIGVPEEPMLHGDPCDLSYTEVYYRANKKRDARILLNNCSGVCKAGTVTALMGPTGAGKTTLLDILAGRKSTGVVSGNVRVNGKMRDKSFRRQTGYVVQDDILMPTLTVKEAIMFSAELRLPGAMSAEQKMLRVIRVMTELGIDHVANTRIGGSSSRGISGGERKRVSIACELVASPRILFLDEPTSGLDSYTAFQLIRLLVSLARQGRTIVVSIHQPRSNIFRMFDNLVLLANGNTVYNGPAASACAHFASFGQECPRDFNPADFLIDAVTMSSAQTVQDYAARFQASTYARQIVDDLRVIDEAASSDALPNAAVNASTHSSGIFTDDRSEDEETRQVMFEGRAASPSAMPSGGRGFASINSGPSVSLLRGASPAPDLNPQPQVSPSPAQQPLARYATGFFQQTSVLCRRTWLNVVRNPFLLLTHYVVVVLLGLFLGSLYFDITDDLKGFQNRSGALFFMLALLAFASLSALDVFIGERVLFVHERASGCYSPLAYFVAKTLCDVVPLRIVPPLIMGTIAYWMIGLQDVALNFVRFLTTLVLTSVTATGLCFTLGAVVPNVGVGNLLSVLILLFFMLFGGFLINRDTVSGPFLFLKYLSFFDYAYEALMANELTNLIIDFNPVGVDADLPFDGKIFLANLGMTPDRIGFDLAILASMGLGYLILSYFLLRTCVKERR